MQNIRSKKHTPWIDAEFKLNRTLRRKYERTWRKNKTDANRKKYVDQRKHCADMSTTKQQAYYSTLVDASSNKQQSLFRMVDKLLDKKEERTLPAHTDTLQLATEFNEYYIDKVQKLRKSIPLNSGNDEFKNKAFEGMELESFEPATEDEIKNLVNEYGIKTSSEDPIPTDVLKLIIDQAVPSNHLVKDQWMA